MYHEMFNSISGLYPPNAISTTVVVTAIKTDPDIATGLSGDKIIAENH